MVIPDRFSLRLLLAPPRPTPRSPRTRLLARWFGLCEASSAARIRSPFIDADQLDELIPEPGQILLISGASGAGKSALLRLIQLRLLQRGCVWTDLGRIVLPRFAVADCFDESIPLSDVLERLSRVGLAEAWTYLRTPDQLSEGQRWRLRLALALGKDTPVLICDEFAAVLDRVTAAVVAHALRRAITRSGKRQSAIVATSHEDLVGALHPDLLASCNFGWISVRRCGSVSTQTAATERSAQG